MSAKPSRRNTCAFCNAKGTWIPHVDGRNMVFVDLPGMATHKCLAQRKLSPIEVFVAKHPITPKNENKKVVKQVEAEVELTQQDRIEAKIDRLIIILQGLK